jgi:hypothetical protein
MLAKNSLKALSKRRKSQRRVQEAIEKGETAGLLEQHRPDVFSTNLGNIPAGEAVTVEIEYIMELKHDAEADGLRFTIPTSIAPRYGDNAERDAWRDFQCNGHENFSSKLRCR